MGTNYSTQTSGLLVVFSGGTTSNVFASSGGIFNTDFALISDAGSIDPTLYQSDLTISFTQSATDVGPSNGPADGDIFWRVFVQVGATIYASNPIAATSTTTTQNVLVSGSVWRVWTGETDLTNGFNIASISGTAGTLPAGLISNIGVLIDDGNDNNDRERLFNFSITGTPIVVVPAPAALPAGLAVLALAAARRRR